MLEDRARRRAEKQTADANGSVCRRNGRAYSAVTDRRQHDAGDRRRLQLPEQLGHAAPALEKCKFINRFTRQRQSVLLHDLAGPVLLGQGRRAAGARRPASSQWDPTTYKYVRYGTGAATFDPQAFTRVDIKSTGFLVNGAAAANPSGRTYAQEMANFANWYAFYRTRILAMKTAAGIAFSALDQNSRVGFHTLWENEHAVHERQGLHRGQQADLVHQRSTRSAPNGGTPLPDAMWRIGELFAGNLAATGLPGATDPLDPVTGKCQPNFHLLSTDGYWNSTLSYASPRQQRPDGARARQSAGRDGIHRRARTFRGRTTKGRRRPATASRTSRCTTGSATSVPASPTR